MIKYILLKTKILLPVLIAIFSMGAAQAQKSKKDSLALAKRFVELLNICKNVDFGDPKTSSAGLFYKAAPYIVYRGDDKKRAWKSFANYSDVTEKKGVDEICTRINETVNRDANYTIAQYRTEKESEGIWHLLMVNYVNNGKAGNLVFAFLKIGGKFGLGDID